MRKFIDIITEANLVESTDFYPAIKSIEDWHGKPTVVTKEPPEFCRQEEVECEWCEGTGHHYDYVDGKKVFDPSYGQCDACEDVWGKPGHGRVKKWVYDFPRMKVSYMMVELLCQVLGKDFDHCGHIDLEDLPALKRRLIGILNKNDVSAFTRPDTDEGGERFVDTSGEIPQIRTTMRTYGSGINDERLRAGVQYMLEIVDWAQKHEMGVTWA